MDEDEDKKFHWDQDYPDWDEIPMATVGYWRFGYDQRGMWGTTEGCGCCSSSERLTRAKIEARIEDMKRATAFLERYLKENE